MAIPARRKAPVDRGGDMMKLSSDQVMRLDALEKQQFVEEVRKAAVSEEPALRSDRGLSKRLQLAYRQAVALGLVSGPAITQFLRHEVIAPGFYQHRAIRAWLKKPGQNVERRFADLLQNVKSKLRGE